MSMHDPYAQLPPPPKMEGQYPDRFEFDVPGKSVEGYLVDVRMTDGGQYDPCPVMDVQTTQVGPDGQPVRWSVFCNPISLWRQLDSLRPAIGSYVKVTFLGLQGRAKVFQLDVANANGQAPTAAPMPQQAPAPAPQPPAPAPAFGAPQPGPAPWEQPAPAPQPAPQPAPAPAPAAPPWGQ